MFLELSGRKFNNRKVLVNTKLIQAIDNIKDGKIQYCLISFLDSDSNHPFTLEVTETFDEIKELLYHKGLLNEL